MRPQSIIYFERIVLLTLALGVVNSWLSWDQAVAAVSARGFGIGFILAIEGVVIAVYLLLLWFIGRRGSVAAKWIYVVFTVAGLIVVLADPRQLLAYGAAPAAISIVQSLLSLVAVWLLFRPDARRWFGGKRDIDPEIFR